MRCVSTRVLPEPAPATMSSGPVDVGDGLRLDRVQALEQRVVGGAHGPPNLLVASDSTVRRPVGPPLPSSLAAPCVVICVRAAATPARRGVVLLDSLNRHLLGCYGGTEFDTPNLDRLAARSVRFTNHHTGSLPCMPARHDLLVGALDFPWRPWGSIEVWEDAITRLLRRDAGHLHDARVATIRTCSRPAARTTTPTSAPGTTCAATRTTRGAPVPTRRGSARRRCRPRRPPVGARLRHRPARGSATRPTSPARGRWRPRPAWLDRELGAERGPTSGPCSSSTSSIRTSPSTRPSRGRAATTPTGRASASSGRRTRRSQEQSGLTDREGVHLRAPVRRQALDDRPLARPHPRRRRPARRVGHHRVHPLHRPRPLPRRARASGASRRCAVHPELGHIPLLVVVAGRRARHAATRSPPPSTCTPRCATSFGVDARAPHARPLARAAARRHRDVRPRVGAVRRVGPRGARRRRRPAPSPRRRSTANRPLSMFSNRWSTMPIRALPGYRHAPARPAGVARPRARHRRAGDPPAVRPERRPAVLGRRPLRRRPALRPGGVRRDRRGPQPGGRRRRRRDDGPARGGAPLDRRARRAARPARASAARTSLGSEAGSPAGRTI